MRPDRPARVDSAMRVFAGRDLFYFADSASRDRFLKDPPHYSKILTDPVDHTRFKPSRRSMQMEFEGRRFYFATDSTFATFKATPERFVLGPAHME